MCIVDSLWGAIDGPTADATPALWQPLCRLVMGTFGPTVDYLTAKNIRGTIMGANPAAAYSGFLTEFGLTAADPTWVVVPASTPTGVARSGQQNNSRSVQFTVCGNGITSTTAQIGLPGAGEHFEISIFDLGGRTVRQMSVGADLNVMWDGRNASGDLLPAGNYLLRLIGRDGVTAETISLVR